LDPNDDIYERQYLKHEKDEPPEIEPETKPEVKEEPKKVFYCFFKVATKKLKIRL